MSAIGNLFFIIFKFCYDSIGNYWLATVFFTLISKVILLPISVIVQKNSIKMVQMYPEINRIKTKFFGNKDIISEKQYELYKKRNYKPILDIIPAILQVFVLMGVVAGFPKTNSNDSTALVLGAAISSFILCFVQNRVNVLQSEQSRFNKIVVMVFSIGLSVFLALFVSKYVVFYWICSNLMSAVQVFILNCFINPKKYIDYDDLKNSKKELQAIEEQNKKNKKARSKELISREKNDYKRFIKYENKQIVFYSEKNGFYKYFKDVIEIILKKTDIIIHYITSDPNDEIFSLTSEYFRTYYIDEKIMVLMMQMDADIVVMTTPDLQNYYIKRSMVRDDIEYIYVDHATNSNNLFYHKDALAHYDTIFVQNVKAYDEIRAQEDFYGYKKKNLIKVGCPLIDNMIHAYSTNEIKENKQKTVLIAPSWQEDNIFDLCIEDLLKQLVETNYQIILRPHPQYIKLYNDRYEGLKNKFSSYPNLIFQDDFSSNSTVYDADVLITDWSGIALEYSFTTLKPVVYINTPMKIINPDYKDIDIVPFNIEARSKIGIEVEIEDIKKINDKISSIFTDKKYSKECIKNIRDNYLYNLGNSAKYGAKYIVDSLIDKYNKSLVVENASTEAKQSNEENKPSTFGNRMITSFIINLFVCLTLFFFSPLELFVGNYSDFVFSIDYIWWILLIFSIVLSLFICLIESLFPSKIHSFVCLLELIFGLLCYIQIIFLNGHVVTLFATNDEIVFSQFTCISNIVIWISIFVLIVIMYFYSRKFRNNFRNISTYICVCLIVIQAFGFAVSCLKLPQKDNINYYLNDCNEFELSNDENTIVFLLDFCDGDYVKETMQEFPDLFDGLDGFTYYPDMISKYTRTYPSIAYLLTGEDTFYDEPYRQCVNKAWENSTFLKRLKQQGTNIGVYTRSDLIGYSAYGIVDNYQTYTNDYIGFINIKSLLKEMSVLSAYRCAPYYAKTLISNIYMINSLYPENINSIANLPEDGAIMENDILFNEELQKRKLKIANDYNKSYRFYHLYSTHAFMNEDFNLDYANGTVVYSLYYDFKIINEYIEYMKELNIYDKSTIVITTDHGDPMKNMEAGDVLTGILLIKEPYENGKTKINYSQMCHDDLFNLLYMNQKINGNEMLNKKRLLYQAQNGETILVEYEVNGDARSNENWHRIGKTKDILYSMYNIEEERRER